MYLYFAHYKSNIQNRSHSKEMDVRRVHAEIQQENHRQEKKYHESNQKEDEVNWWPKCNTFESSFDAWI